MTPAQWEAQWDWGRRFCPETFHSGTELGKEYRGAFLLPKSHGEIFVLKFGGIKPWTAIAPRK